MQMQYECVVFALTRLLSIQKLAKNGVYNVLETLLAKLSIAAFSCLTYKSS